MTPIFSIKSVDGVPVAFDQDNKPIGTVIDYSFSRLTEIDSVNCTDLLTTYKPSSQITVRIDIDTNCTPTPS